ncbi:MAG: 2-oxo acid dehydrogenase subunit E2, partial [Verrucomicrobia bacterium]|nr:2-oxo acid dehydrogenase subunit E2 [Verrucomicrobiota bacterium]
MPKVPIIMPQLGESIAEATVVRLTANVGEQVDCDQEVIEVETNKAVMSVTTPCKGVIESLMAEVNETYPVGDVLGYIEASAEDAERLSAAGPLASDAVAFKELDRTARSIDEADASLHPSQGLEIPLDQTGSAFLSPRLKARLQELGIHAADTGVVPGSGIGG